MKRAVALLALLLAVVFLPFTVGTKTLLSSARDVQSVLPGGARGDSAPTQILKAPDAGAAGWQTEPYFAIMHAQLLREHVAPSWNPYSGFGTPLAGNFQSQPYYPPSFLYALAPSPVTYNWWVLLRLLIAGAGMFAFLRWYVSFVPALLGAVATMLTGYYVMHYDMPHLSVDVLLPALLFAVEYAVRKPGPASFAFMAAVAYGALAGGMPESTLLVLSFTVVYLLFVLALRRDDRGAVLRGAIVATAGLAVGVAASAAVLFPFLEFWHVAFTSHDPSRGASVLPGPRADQLTATIGQYVAPLLIGPPRNNIFESFNGFSGLRGYFGIAAGYFFLIAVVDVLTRRPQRRIAPTDAVLAFFVVATLVVIAKRYGFPLVNWIGYLPAFQYVSFPTFQETLLAVTVPACAAIGLERLLVARVPLWNALVCAAAWLAAITALEAIVGPRLGTASHAGYFDWAIVTAALALTAAVAVAVAAASPQLPAQYRKLLGPAAVAIVALELSCNYIVPLFYLHNPEPSAATDPYRGAPFVTYLQSVAPPGQARVLGKDGYLYPSWPGAFGLAGVTQLDALTYERYLPWIRAFLARPGPSDPDLYDRYTGTSRNTFGTPQERRFLQLGSVKYVVANAIASGDEALISGLSSDAAGAQPKDSATTAQAVTLGAQTKDGFLLQPPPGDLPFSIDVPPNAKELVFYAGLVPPGAQACAAATTLRVQLEGGPNAARRSVDFTPQTGRWTRYAISVGALRGRSVQANLSTLRRGAERCTPELALSAPRFEPASAPRSTLRRLPVQDAPVYELSPVLPRAALFYSVDLQRSGEAALRSVSEPGFDIFSRAVVEAPATAADGALRALAAAAPRNADAATVRAYGSTRVAVEANPPRPALLMLNDTNYPGWTATVDGQPAQIYPADYLFRGIVLTPGPHRVEFVYDPVSQRAGLAVSLAALLVAMLAVLAWPAFSRR